MATRRDGYWGLLRDALARNAAFDSELQRRARQAREAQAQLQSQVEELQRRLQAALAAAAAAPKQT